MQRNLTERGADRRRYSEHAASPPTGGQANPGYDDDDPENEYVPAYFSAPEFEARAPANERRSGERRGSGSPAAKLVKPLGSDDEPLGGE